MKSIEEIKNKIARESYGCDNWDDFYIGNKEYPKELSEAFEEVAIEYAKQAVNAKLEEVDKKVDEELNCGTNWYQSFRNVKNLINSLKLP